MRSVCRQPDAARFWLVQDYVPEIDAIDQAIFPKLDEYAEHLGPVEVHPVPIPHDCSDGFLGAYWRRPEAYLDPVVRRSISTFSQVSSAGPGLERLAADLESGAWDARHGACRAETELDVGYRLVVARPKAQSASQ